jgi:hypothetical protein
MNEIVIGSPIRGGDDDLGFSPCVAPSPRSVGRSGSHLMLDCMLFLGFALTSFLVLHLEFKGVGLVGHVG